MTTTDPTIAPKVWLRHRHTFDLCASIRAGVIYGRNGSASTFPQTLAPGDAAKYLEAADNGDEWEAVAIIDRNPLLDDFVELADTIYGLPETHALTTSETLRRLAIAAGQLVGVDTTYCETCGETFADEIAEIADMTFTVALDGAGDPDVAFCGWCTQP